MALNSIKPLLSSIALLFFFQCSLVHAASSPNLIPVTVEQVHQHKFISTIEEMGKLQATDSAVLTFGASAKITTIYFKDGDAVKKGDVIAQLNSVKAKADVDKAISTLALAKSNYDRSLEMIKKQPGSLPSQNLDQLKENTHLAEADLRQKQAILQDYQLIAPFDGQLTNFTQSVGSQISPSTALVSIYKLNPVEVSYSISQHDLGRAAKGQKIKMTVEAFDKKVFSGVVDYVAPAVDKSSGRVMVHARIDNPNHQLAPGMFAHVEQLVNKHSEHILAPQNSVMTRDLIHYVWVVNPDHSVTQHELTLGTNTNNGYVIVNKGLTAGDNVVTTGQQKLTESSTVNIITPSQRHKDKIKKAIDNVSIPQKSTQNQSTRSSTAPSKVKVSVTTPTDSKTQSHSGVQSVEASNEVA